MLPFNWQGKNLGKKKTRKNFLESKQPHSSPLGRKKEMISNFKVLKL